MTIDATEFLSKVIEVASAETQRTPVPIGDYTMQIGMGEKDLAVEQGVADTKDGKKPWARLDVNVTVIDPTGHVKAITGRDPCVMRHGVMLDLDPVSGKLDTTSGKNIRLWALFAASGWPVDEKKRLQIPDPSGNHVSFGWLKGKSFKGKVEHEPNPKDPSQLFDRIARVTTVS